MDNLSIKLKILVLVGIFGLLTVVAAVYADLSMRSIDSGYSELINHGERAAVSGAR